MSRENDIKHNLMVNAARLYYLKRMTHLQIAHKLCLSRVKVTRLLKEAVERKIVQFKIQDPIVHTLELQDEMENKFGLGKVVIAPSADTESGNYDTLGAYAADFLMSNLKDNLTIGLSWGRTLNAMVPYLRHSPKKNVNVVSVNGGLAANANQPNPYDVTTSVAEKIGATPHYLLVPAIVESVKVKRLLLKEKNAREITHWWSKIEFCMMSIGVLSERTGIFYSFEEPISEVKRAKALGGVGDMIALPFDRNGGFLKTNFTERTITIDLQLLKKIPFVVGVAGGRKKADSILGALKTGILNVLITDEKCARQVLALEKRQIEKM